MSEDRAPPARAVPPRALVLSLLALLVPVGSNLLLPPGLLGAYQALLWLVALIPAFLLAYHKGWKGAAIALAAGMAALSFTQAAATVVGRPIPDLLLGVVVAYVALALGIGWLAERLHRDRARVEGLAYTDLLTHLPNRRHARIFLENEFAAAQRGRPLSVVLFDLDNFKLYNDRFGHAAGDDGLKDFAEILSQNTRRMNLSARFGGEEFITVLADSDAEGALIFAERIRAGLRTWKLDRGSLTVSAGVASYQPGIRSVDELLAAADHALYRSKREGKNRVTLYAAQPDAHRSVREAPVDARGEDTALGYPRWPEEIGKTEPPPGLLPHFERGFGAGRKVLLMQEDNDTRTLLASALEEAGFTVKAVGEIRDAIQELRWEYDVLVLEVRLPGRWGMEVIGASKARWPATQILVITGVSEAQLTAEAITAGADRHLGRPFGMPEFRRELAESLSRRGRVLMERAQRSVMTGAVRDQEDRARLSVLEGVRALVQAVETRDPFLRGHHARVSRFATEILGAFDPEGVLLSPGSLLLGTQLLDVGMIDVPLSVLNKTEPLTSEEMLLIQKHPVTGRRVLEPLLGDEIALQIVGWHHERWDGGGYPNGLMREAIPLGARIASVADALDSLTSPRAFRDAFPWEGAVAKIQEDTGARFDPRVTEALLRALPRLEAIFREMGSSSPGSDVPAGEEA